ncbi:MAG: glycosyltransferase family 2 protein [Bacteroidota bacterium]
METLLIISILILFYTYLGYGIIMYTMSKITGGNTKKLINPQEFPSVAILIPAYNEEDFIEDKILNTIALNYPKLKKNIYVITDGSTDGTVGIVKNYQDVTLLHKDGRSGKVGAVNRAMDLIHADITISTDANTLLNKDALHHLVKPFADSKVMAVSGEKKIISDRSENASGAGEGMYWKYESTLKRLDSEVNSMVGAAGELIAYRTNKFEKIPQNMIIEDFFMTMRFAEQGYKVAYEPKAYAMEKPSASVKDELKRKIRISAGAFQSIILFRHLLNPARLNMLSFQYLSHRVLRWTIAPIALITALVSNLSLAGSSDFFTGLAVLQVAFYLMAGIGYLFKKLKLKAKVLHVPFYFCMMNYAVFAGFIRFIKGEQSVIWEKALRRA